MIDLIRDDKKFNRIEEAFNEIFIVDVDFEENPFIHKFKYFVVFEFDIIFEGFFSSSIIKVLEGNNENLVSIYTIDPSPAEYYKIFKKYNAFEIRVNDTKEEINKIFMLDPGGNIAGAMAISSNEISWIPEFKEWAILGSRFFEFGVAGFVNQKVKNNFVDSFGQESDRLFNVEDLLKLYSFPSIGFKSGVSSGYKNFVDSYKNRD